MKNNIHFNRSRLLWSLIIGLVACLPCDLRGQIQTTFTEPFITSQLAAAESGIVQQIRVKEGDFVRKGSIIALLDRAVIQQSLKYAKAKANSEARIDVARARLRLAEQKNNSLQKLDREGHANKREVHVALTEFEQATAELQVALDDQRVAQLEVERIEAELERRLIRCPYDGYITEIHKKIGEYVSSAEPQLVTLAKLSKLRARFYLTVAQAKKLEQGKQVRIKVEDQFREATVVFVSPIVDPDSRTLRVDVEIDNPKMKLTSGVSCQWSESFAVQNAATPQPIKR